MFFPEIVRFFVGPQSVFFIPLINRGIKVVAADPENAGKQFPGPGDGFLFEVSFFGMLRIAERPVSQHLKHCVMVSVVAHFFKVIMLSRNAQTFLCVGHTVVFDGCISEKQFLELIHTGIGKHQRGIVLDDHRCGRNYFMIFSFKILKKGCSYF